jgi:hypothetical protein
MTWSDPIDATISMFLVLAHAGHFGARCLGDLHVLERQDLR